MPYVVRLSPEGWPLKQEEQNTAEVEDAAEIQNQDVKVSAKRSAWARLIKKVYGINLLDRDVQIQVEPSLSFAAPACALWVYLLVQWAPPVIVQSSIYHLLIDLW